MVTIIKYVPLHKQKPPRGDCKYCRGRGTYTETISGAAVIEKCAWCDGRGRDSK